ncbi:MAG: RtcB family protein [Dehalococcoidia bacterium]|jgi:tRNA-splicing ligase RtcB|nr:RtcB family protein [Dehalococcoidia bacterium]MDP7470168.1 RtcB family protein [Dehalococcoidia bacterium]
MAKWDGPLGRIDDYRWEIPRSYKEGMRVPGLIYSDEEMLGHILNEQALEQVANVAFLPGIVGRSLAMPDIHWGYGFAIGGVAATRADDGVISPGGVGYDINCGVRLLRSDLHRDEVLPHIRKLMDQLFADIPSGVGVSGRIRVDNRELSKVMVNGARWAVERGYGEADDLEMLEEGGAMKGADHDGVSRRARERGAPQLGTLGSGNHFIEIAAVSDIYEPEVARVLGIDREGQVVVLIHSGSRGLGHQVCEDNLRVMEKAVKKYDIRLPDRQLACAPFTSPEGQDYFGAMAAAANYAWANRQAMTHWVRQALAKAMGRSTRDLGLRLVYDVAHNIAKVEEHTVGDSPTRVVVHRKGATRAFPPGHHEIPLRYRMVGQPVLIPGDMGRYSYLLTGTEAAMKESWGSTCHGAGRMQSRSAAKRAMKGQDIAAMLEKKGITVRASSRSGMAEEASEAYKDVAQVVEVVRCAGISRKVMRSRPLGVIKG